MGKKIAWNNIKLTKPIKPLTRIWTLFEVNLTRSDPFWDPESQKLVPKLDWTRPKRLVFKVKWCFLILFQFWMKFTKKTKQIYLWNIFVNFLTPLGFLGAYSGAQGKSYLHGWMLIKFWSTYELLQFWMIYSVRSRSRSDFYCATAGCRGSKTRPNWWYCLKLGLYLGLYRFNIF